MAKSCSPPFLTSWRMYDQNDGMSSQDKVEQAGEKAQHNDGTGITRLFLSKEKKVEGADDSDGCIIQMVILTQILTRIPVGHCSSFPQAFRVISSFLVLVSSRHFTFHIPNRRSVPAYLTSSHQEVKIPYVVSSGGSASYLVSCRIMRESDFPVICRIRTSRPPSCLVLCELIKDPDFPVQCIGTGL